MKIYRFNPETGSYLGEDFADESAMRRGDLIIDNDATTLPPPVAGPGQVLRFDSRAQCWQLCPAPSLAGNRFHGRLAGQETSGDMP
ncbi:MAG TPA: hypothetical protein VIU41_15740 [Geobacteraceae bacterium]